MSQAEGIPDALITIQSSFKLIVEQLKQLSDRSNQIASSCQEANSQLETKLKDKANYRLQALLTSLGRSILKLFAQLLVNKFDSLVIKGTKDSKQLSTLLHHFAEYSIGPLLVDIQEAVGQSVGESVVYSFTLPIKDHIAQFLNKIDESGAQGRPLILNAISSISACSQTDPLEISEKKVMEDKGNQYQGISISSRSQQTQIEDSVANRKIELLMTSNKKMVDQIKLIKDDIARKDEELEKALGRASICESKVNELSRQLEEERVESRSLKKLNEHLKSELQILVMQNKELAPLREIAGNEGRLQSELEKSNANINLLNERLRLTNQDYETRLAALASQLEILANELEVEKSANYQLQSELSSQIQSTYSIKNQLNEVTKAKQDSEEAYKEISKSHGELMTELRDMKENEKQTLETHQAALKNAERIFKDQLAEIELKHKRTVERLNEKLQQATFEMSKQASESSVKVVQMKERLDGVISESEDKDRLIRELQTSINLLTDSKAELQGELEHLKCEIITEKKKADNDCSAKSQQEEEIKRLKEKLNETGYRIRDLEKENNSYKELKINLSMKLEQNKDSLEDLTARLKAKEDEVSSLQTSNLQLSERHAENLNRLQSQYEIELSKLAAEKTQVYKENENLQFKLIEKEAILSNKIEHYERRLASLAAEHDEDMDLRKDLDSLQDEIAHKAEMLIQEKSSKEKLQIEYQNIIAQLSDLEKKNQTLEHSLKEVVDENTQMSTLLKTTGDKLKQQTVITEQLREAKERIEEENEMTKSQLERLKATLQDTEAKSASMQDLSSTLAQVRAELEQKQTETEELGAQVAAVTSKLNERNALLKKANEEFKELEKEAIELRPMKKEIISISIQLSKAREDLLAKDKAVEKLVAEADQQKKLLLDKCREAETMSEQFKKTLEDIRQRQEAAGRQQAEAEKRLREEHATELERLRVESSNKLEVALSEMRQEVADRDKKIGQLIRDTESQNISLAHEKNEIISKLEEQLKEKDEIARVLKEQMVKSADEFKLKLTEQAELLASKLESQAKSHKQEAAAMAKEIESKDGMLKVAKEETASLKIECESLSRIVREGEKKHGELSEKIGKCDEYIQNLIAANDVLTKNLKSMKRNQNSLPRANPSVPTETTSIQVAPALHGQTSQKGPTPNLHEKKSDSQVISNFDKNLSANTSLQPQSNPISQYLKNKENSDTSNVVVQRKSHGSGSIKKYTREEYEKILAERLLNQEQNAPPFSYLKPPGVLQHAGNKLQFTNSPTKPQGLLTPTIGGLHQLSEQEPVEADGKADEAAKGYSSRYSRNSRKSRNSRQSPTPNKETHMSVH